MIDFEETLLWKVTLASKPDDKDDANRIKLRDSYYKARKNAEYILNKIRVQFPNLTLHDISHIDALWQTASVIIGRKDYPITPLEGYVLGCAFLLHDAALCYEAYGGITQLRDKKEWADYYAEEKENTSQPEKEKLFNTDFKTIRLLHASQAINMVNTQFKHENGSKFYIIEDDDLRTHLGKIIGEIAASHHWDLNKVAELNEQQNAMAGYPQEWRMNPKKLACIIRCADAAHIDANRAPDYLLNILNLNGVSMDHWKAQNRLSQIDADQSYEHQAIISSTYDFEEKDFAAWNVAYDAVMIIDKEIKACNKLLEDIDKNLCFNIKQIAGSSSREALAKYIKVNGWLPTSADIHVSNIKSLIEKFGGENLYGDQDQILIVIRELLQNARDAIKAREYIDNDFNPNDGRIDIAIENKDNDNWIVISDNGIGMNRETIVSSLLDFGSSFWASDLAKIQYPGLRSSNFQSIGGFGIGFYSVFMVASQVIVESRRYDDAHKDTIALNFPSGLTLTPVMKKVHGSSKFSTCIKIKLNPQKTSWTNNYEIKRNIMGQENFKVPFSAALSSLCAGLDVNVYYQDTENKAKKIHTDITAIIDSKLEIKQWLRDISYADHQQNKELDQIIDETYPFLEPIKQNGKLVGLAALSSYPWNNQIFLNINTIGGLASEIHTRDANKFIGYLDHQPLSASRRDAKKMIATPQTIKQWINNQLELRKSVQSDSHRTSLNNMQYSIAEFKADPISIALAYVYQKSEENRKLININELLDLLLNGKKFIIVIMGCNIDAIDFHLNYSKQEKELKTEDILFIPTCFGHFIDSEFINNKPANDYSFIGCLYRVAEQKNILLNREIIDHYADSSLGLSRAYIFTATNNHNQHFNNLEHENLDQSVNKQDSSLQWYEYQKQI